MSATRHVLRIAASIWMLQAAIGSAADLPARFEHDRIFLEPRTTTGEVIRFYTDTGGGWNMVASSVARRLALPRLGQVSENGRMFDLVAYPAFDPDHAIPPPGDADFNDGLLVSAPDELAGAFGDGFLGARWFANRVWTFDYARGTLSGASAGSNLSAGGDDVVALGFQVGDDGKRTTHFPRITVEVDGEALDMLFDTGATITATAASADALGVAKQQQVGGSFISASVFDRWRARHADWRVIEGGDAVGRREAPLIQVPSITIAGTRAGPVWFAARPAGTFEGWMSGMMDAPIVGAIGGSGLRYYRVTVDYPAALARFEPAARAR